MEKFTLEISFRKPFNVNYNTLKIYYEALRQLRKPRFEYTKILYILTFTNLTTYIVVFHNTTYCNGKLTFKIFYMVFHMIFQKCGDEIITVIIFLKTNV
jgi:hypothetical protein